ncbi:clindamycin resistance transfer factor BtgA [Bacteroides salyersiae]|jgi:clindamycin resistance transfer factor btgA|uniref:BfmA/BtgA family mobilization protein n=1 Tax=Bacteroides salyersiae TaxID=291644 RepID=UPI001C38D268|nr:BfmA/BtgA family mobilization protein [Bacteroides salyersiae]MBV4204630.1 clindamycin resistance transfer factor BtgA [Bacteroides salyersiae]MCB6650180.1 clindamycin resistance transfer factor BtgA [Bacteroides salyersiae]
MTKQNRNIIFTTIAVENTTDKLIEKLCKRYSLKKGEIVKLAFLYLEKAHINPADAPESVKSELAKINKRQDDIIRFIRKYEEDQLNPMIRTNNTIAVKFDTTVKALSEKVDLEIKTSNENLINVLKKLDEQFGKMANVINNQAKQINDLSQVSQRDKKKLLQLISLYSDLAICGVMEGKRKENLKAEIINLINE